MKTIYKTIYYLGVFAIWYCSVALTIANFLPLEWNNTNYEISFWYHVTLCFSLPVAILLTLFKLCFVPQNRKEIIKQIITTSFISVCVGFVMIFFLVGGTMCGMMTGDTLFQSKQNNVNKIVQRYYDCGATDTGVPKIEIYKVVPLTNLINFVIKVDTTSIDTTEWTRFAESRYKKYEYD